MVETASQDCFSLQTDASIQMQSEIDTLQRECDELTASLTKMRIGKRYVLAEEDKRIFTRDGPVKERKNNDTCNSCQEFRFTKEKQRVWCEFCGFCVCEPCSQKKRAFPKSKIGKNGEQPRGRICNLCERRTLHKQMVSGSHTKSLKMEKQFNSTQKDITALLGELQAL